MKRNNKNGVWQHKYKCGDQDHGNILNRAIGIGYEVDHELSD